jgi:hypothetical protein
LRQKSSDANGGNLKPVEVPGIRKGICDEWNQWSWRGMAKNTAELYRGISEVRKAPHGHRIWKAENTGPRVDSNTILIKQQNYCQMLLNVHGIDSVFVYQHRLRYCWNCKTL